MSKKMKILLFIVIVIICAVRFSYLKENSDSFNKGLERTEEIKDGVGTVVNDIGDVVKGE